MPLKPAEGASSEHSTFKGRRLSSKKKHSISDGAYEAMRMRSAANIAGMNNAALQALGQLSEMAEDQKAKVADAANGKEGLSRPRSPLPSRQLPHLENNASAP